MRYTLVFSSQYKKALRKIKRREPEAVRELEKVMLLLISGKQIPQKYKDHGLSGRLQDVRELHACPDVLLMYKKYEDMLILQLVNIGSHSDLF